MRNERASSAPDSINEVQTNIGDPNNATGWKTAGVFNGGKATLSGLTPVRTVGLKGGMGAWERPRENNGRVRNRRL